MLNVNPPTFRFGKVVTLPKDFKLMSKRMKHKFVFMETSG